MSDKRFDGVQDRLVVALDGPAGAGKGTVCRAVARRCGLAYLDTGSIYRAVGLLSLEKGLEKGKDIANVASSMDFSFRLLENNEYHAFLNGVDVSRQLREERVGEQASKVSALPEVRAALLDFQRAYGGAENAILDGRDVGTVVFPDAGLKIFLTASLEERAKRRALELQAREETVSLSEIRQRMAERDARDAGRTHAPMAHAEDAVIIDTSDLSPQEASERVVNLVLNMVG